MRAQCIAAGVFVVAAWMGLSGPAQADWAEEAPGSAAEPAVVDNQATGAVGQTIGAVEPWDAVESYQPLWTARAGAIFLQRGRPQNSLFIVNGNTGEPWVNPNNFVFPYQAGADLGLIRHGQWADLEVRYFGVNDSLASQGPFNFGPGAALAVGNMEPSPTPLTVDTVYASSLNSVESNLRRNVSNRLSLLAGFRYVSLRDRLHIAATDGVDPVGITFGTVNNLFGFQIGADAILWDSGNRFRVESAIKAGVYGNGATLNLTFADRDENNTFSAGRDHTAFVGDLSFTGVYQLNDRWALRGGYQMLWLTGVAVANEQLHGLNFDGGPAPSVNVTHSAFFQGAMFGVERCW
jgi:hypothetical protein